MHWLDFLQDPRLWNIVLFVGGAFLAWFERKQPALYKDAAKYVKMIGGMDTVYGIIDFANGSAEYKTSKEKQAYVAKRIKQLLKDKAGIEIPDYTVNLIVEWVYTCYKNTVSK